MKRKTYSAEFKEQALSKAHDRGQRTLQEIADEGRHLVRQVSSPETIFSSALAGGQNLFGFGCIHQQPKPCRLGRRIITKKCAYVSLQS
jgi:hypothetical protein